MKKIIVLFAFLFTIGMNAQELKIGLTLAPTISFNKNMIDNKGWETVEGTGGLGWKGGLLADFNFAGNYYFHSGVLIHSKSFANDNSNQSVTSIEVPVALKLRSKEVSDNVHITGFFGGTLDFNVAARYTDTDGKEKQNIDNFNKLGTSFMAGAGVEYDLDFGAVGIGLSYHLGLSNIINVDKVKTIPKHLSVDLVFYF